MVEVRNRPEKLLTESKEFWRDAHMGWDSREVLNRATWPQSLCYSCRYQHLVVHVWSPMAATRAEGREGGGSAEWGALRAQALARSMGLAPPAGGHMGQRYRWEQQGWQKYKELGFEEVPHGQSGAQDHGRDVGAAVGESVPWRALGLTRM